MATLTLEGSTSGNVVVTVPAISGTGNTVTIPATTGTLSVASTSTSGGIFFGGATSGVLYQDASNLYWDDTNNKLGIGTNAPSNALHVSEASSDFQVRVTGTSAANAGSIRAYNDGGQAIGLGMSGSTNSGYGANVGFLGTITNVPQLFLTNNIERARFLTTGNVLCLSGGSTSANGTGIAFPATQSASSDANTLDDYEEGTWTPVVKFGGNSVGVSYTSQLGTYTKVGRLIQIKFRFLLSSKGSSTGAMTVQGIPFTPAETYNATGVMVGEGSLTGMPAAIYGLMWNDGNIYIRYGGATSFVNITDANFTNTSDMYGSIVYYA